MNICFITYRFPPDVTGGGEISNYVLIKNLANLNHKVVVLTRKLDNLKPLKQEYNIEVQRIISNPFPATGYPLEPYSLLLAKKIVSFLKNRNVRLLHVLDFRTTPGAIIAAKILRKPILVTIRNYWPMCPRLTMFIPDQGECAECAPSSIIKCLGKWKTGLHHYIFMILRRLFLKRADKIICVSKFVRNILFQTLRISKSKLATLYNIPEYHTFDSTGIYQTNLKKDYGHSEDDFIVGYVGRITFEKGIEYLIRAFDNIVKITDQIKLVIAGDGNKKIELQELVKELKLNKYVNFAGFITHEDIPSFYELCDIIVLPSIWDEPLSRVLLETFHSSKPVIATKTGGTPEIIKDGENGLLVEPKNSDQIADKILFLYNNPDIRKRIQENVKSYSIKNLNSRALTKKFLNMYKTVLSESG
ncbi:MAG: glycosyltransferase family 4 protein [Candidatus Lokiarchaeota archaeon]|nr:glycosyltransferase family 4 protein [Candidatus Lokiarchaeota archaeon]